MRKTPLHTDCIYHVYNRGVEKRDIFLNPSYYFRFVSLLKHYLQYNCPFSVIKRQLDRAKTSQEKQEVVKYLETQRTKPPVELISFCLMPNHYHLTLKQSIEGGITSFMHRIGTGYANYFNMRQERTGRLFESTFKVVVVESERQLLHLTRYQHLNPRKLDLTTSEELTAYPWSTLATYLGADNFSFIETSLVLATFDDPKSYRNFVFEDIDEFEPFRLEPVAIDDDFGWFGKLRSLEKGRRAELRERYLEKIAGIP